MSTSPANQSEIKQLLQADSEYQTNLSRLNKMMKMGGSLSGHERNCAFLNLGGESFATVSSVAGIDFADDGRGVATTDWDGDGDLDFWTTNRTGPRLRLMRHKRCFSKLLTVRLVPEHDKICSYMVSYA